MDELILTRSRAVIKIDHKIHKHLIGKAGSNINKIKSDTGVNIKIPQEEGQEIEVCYNPFLFISAYICYMFTCLLWNPSHIT